MWSSWTRSVGAADASRVEGELAAVAVAEPHLALDGGGDVAGGGGLGRGDGGGAAGRAERRAWPLHLRPAACLPLEEEVEGGFEDLLGGGAGQGVAEPSPGGGDLVEEPGRDGEVEAAEVG